MLSVVVDLGGTNIRLAVCDLKTGGLSQLKEFVCADFMTLESVLSHYFSLLNEKVNSLCLAIACPVDGDYIAMTNLSWAFSKQALQKQFNLSFLSVINDYTAISLAVPFLPDDQKVQIGGGVIKPEGVKAIFGPGTGLGVSHILKIAEKWVSLEGEGGHVSFAPTTDEQIGILSLLNKQFSHVSAERLLSGAGLMNIYNSLCTLSQTQAKLFTPQDISKAALNNSCPIAHRSLAVFCEIMGGFAGDLAISLNCTGGVYIAGGIVPRFVTFFLNSEFRRYFENKGPLSAALTRIPTFLIINNNPGLLGASVYLRQELGVIK